MEDIQEKIDQKGYHSKIRLASPDIVHNVYEIDNFDSNEFLNLLSFIKDEDPDSRIVVNKKLYLVSQSYTSNVDFSDCIFNEPFSLENCTFYENVDLRNCTFNSRSNFKRTKFEKKVRFHHTNFNLHCSFENTVFQDLADFFAVNFNVTQQFYLTDFLGITIFSHAVFNHSVQFLYNKTSKDTIISFENATFFQSLDISRANFWCKMSFWKVEITTLPNELWLYETDRTTEKHNFKPSNSYKVLRETYRIIKDTFHREGNQIEALLYYRSEMLIYEKEISSDNNKSYFEDKISLFFNKYSNIFGTSWLQGLGFTLIVTIFFYLSFLLVLSDELNFDFSWFAIATTLKHLVEFLNIAKWDIKPFGIEFYNWAYIVLFIGRIFISYGYYQTIQGFRKYGKS
jgi:hypothetical protein